MKCTLPTMVASVALTSAALADGTVTLTLSSPTHGATFGPGTLVSWTITSNVSVNDNDGLAGICVDLVQDPTNPEHFDLANSLCTVPPGMAGFARTAGISNPESPNTPLGYCGTLVGETGRRNLSQIGGAQNLFGAVGSTIGLDAMVDIGIGHGGQVIIAGTFIAPETYGVYRFSLQSGIANVIVLGSVPPRATPATVLLSSFQFTIDCLADFDNDGFVVPIDYNLFINAFEANDPSADVNGDGFVDPLDYNTFINAFEVGC